MRYHEYSPHGSLQDTVKCFWIHEATYPSETAQDIAPDGCVELIFNFGSPYLLRTTDPPTALPPAIIVGFQNKTIPLLLHGTLQVVAARLFAWGALALAWLPACHRHVAEELRRTLRFQETQRRLMFDPDADLTELAQDCGYFDQAHFIKDFKAFTGRTPMEYARQMRAMQEILKSKDVVFLQSPSASSG